MAILHGLRNFRYILKGKLRRKSLVAAYVAQHPEHSSNGNRSTGIPMTEALTTKVYLGWRMADMLLHVNNARYLEAFEYGRWDLLYATGQLDRMMASNCHVLVGSSHVQFLKEVKPFTTVVIRTTWSGSTKRWPIVKQQMESKDGQTVYAVGVLTIPMVIGPKREEGRRGAISTEEFLDRMQASPAERAHVLSPASLPPEMAECFAEKPVTALVSADENWRNISQANRRSKRS